VAHTGARVSGLPAAPLITWKLRFNPACIFER
jgi:hypothetical protein